MAVGYPERLLQQATILVTADSGRPRQVNLRRAVSASYYSVFHFVIDQACRSVIGSASVREPLRRILARGFEHGTMREASKTVAGGNLPKWMGDVAPQLAVPADLRGIADTFVKLQDERHRADYDLSRPFTRYEASVLTMAAHDAIGRWPNVAADDATRLDLAGLLCWKTLRQR